MTDNPEAKVLFAWVTRCPDNTVSQVSAYVPSLGANTSLVSRDRRVAEFLRPIAQQHADSSGQRVWLREYRDFVDHGDA